MSLQFRAWLSIIFALQFLQMRNYHERSARLELEWRLPDRARRKICQKAKDEIPALLGRKGWGFPEILANQVEEQLRAVLAFVSDQKATLSMLARTQKMERSLLEACLKKFIKVEKANLMIPEPPISDYRKDLTNFRLKIQNACKQLSQKSIRITVSSVLVELEKCGHKIKRDLVRREITKIRRSGDITMKPNKPPKAEIPLDEIDLRPFRDILIRFPLDKPKSPYRAFDHRPQWSQFLSSCINNGAITQIFSEIKRQPDLAPPKLKEAILSKPLKLLINAAKAVGIHPLKMDSLSCRFETGNAYCRVFVIEAILDYPSYRAVAFRSPGIRENPSNLGHKTLITGSYLVRRGRDGNSEDSPQIFDLTTCPLSEGIKRFLEAISGRDDFFFCPSKCEKRFKVVRGSFAKGRSKWTPVIRVAGKPVEYDRLVRLAADRGRTAKKPSA